MKKKAVIGVIVLVIAVGVILGWTLLKNEKNGVIRYKQEAITKGDIEAMVITTGTLNPVTTVEVGSQVSGKIANIFVDFNSQVKKGEILAELDRSILEQRVEQNQANYLSAMASLEKAKVTLANLQKQYERSLSLFDKNLISFEEKDIAEANYLGAKADLKRAEASVEQAKSQVDSSKVDLGYAIIRSPIDGVVISRDVNVGQTVQASFTAPKLFEIANDLTKMQVECSVDEADIGKVKESQEARFTVDAFPEDTFKGVVRQVRYSPTVTQNVVTYTTIVDVDNPALKLRPGMTATISIITGEAKGVLKIPNAALRFTPTLPPEEMAKIMKDTQEKMMAKRKAEGQTQAQGASPAQQPSQGTAGSGPRMNFAQSGGGAQGLSGMGGGTRGARKPSMVWYLDENGKLNIAFIRPGVTDNAYTEMLRGDLKEGQEVITGLETGTQSAQSSSSQRPPQRMMFVR
jgi:HlyD family secretion protein